MPEALHPDTALALVLEAAPVLPPEEAPYGEVLGRILREEVRAEHDYPPFDKALMDGYAVIATDLKGAPRTLRVIEEIPAGAEPERLLAVAPGTASRIMTGAPIPPGADAVLIVEETEPVPGRPQAIRAAGAVKPGDSVARRGADTRAGTVLLEPGEFIGPGEIGVLAACGRTVVQVGRRPRVAVLATGDELVEPGQAPGPGRIRNSNGPLLTALATRAGAEARYLGIAPDDEAALSRAIEGGLADDLLVLSGGVSMGTRDLVAGRLRSLGVQILFDRVTIKPGKPFTFGRRGTTLVFGCPGNPVSSYVIFQVFVRPALRKMMGFAEPVPERLRGRLETDVRQRPGRVGYHQARARWIGDGFGVAVLPTTGSADFVSCARGNVLAIVPADVASLAPGDPIDFLPLDDRADR
jgi:molybdopterin molybdotransferase